MEFAPETINIADLLDANLVRFDPVAQAKNISIETNSNIAAAVLADSRMIDTVLRNLISNSIKFTESGGQISLNVITYEGSVKVSITDSGVGMSPEKANNLFDLGVKTSTTGTDGESGTGLGL
ncbi:MAG: HAMP domain-containing histidine kinase, partial [Rhodospirillales bacterium]|nr:HAMP domain-containing histidine kinase [Rhodospirillales bacterium]